MLETLEYVINFIESDYMENLQKIAMLIDADNTQLAKLEAVQQEISTRGRIVVKRAYGNWRKDALKNWENELKRLAIKAEQQFDYVPGKNATDMALVIDAVNMRYKDIYDAFVIVASDSDYTPLAINLHESGVYVIGVGEKKTPEAFRNSCDEFIFLENLGSSNSSKSKKDIKQSSKKEEAESIENDDDDISEIHYLLRIAYDKYQDDNGYANMSAAGQYIKRAKPDFDPKTYGYSKLSQLIESYPYRYEVKKFKGPGSVLIYGYKCL